MVKICIGQWLNIPLVVRLKMVMVAGHGEAWQAVFLSLPYNSGADCGAAPDVVPEKVPSLLVPILRVVPVLMVVPTMVSGYIGGACDGYGVRATLADGYV